ncbi:dipeptide ABC transporter ATP-binding protein [Anderseniella sp. Alg231-50]|uniref:ABC transporter ATP-binding protein n=1 Tax=Anderseniella sp. Alg231-50 TaxID=1922226 RepID=UPI000D561761
MSEKIVLRANDLKKHYMLPGSLYAKPATVKALDGVSFELSRKKTLAVVGESGCGKSTLARLVTMIEDPTAGSLQIAGEELADGNKAVRRKLRPKVQMVFQNPYGSLNPRQKIGSALEEPLMMNTPLSKAERSDKAKNMMQAVGLRPEHYDRYPHMFSGGQRQRIAIARALMLDPDILVLDEPVSALDVSIQAQVLNLLGELQDKLQLAYLFISHDLSVVKHIADEVMVMYLGKPVEQASREVLFDNPRHPYTKALLSATPVPDPGRQKERVLLKGELPSPIDPPTGCAFHPRCPVVFGRCAAETPHLQPTHSAQVSCHLMDEAQ